MTFKTSDDIYLHVYWLAHAYMYQSQQDMVVWAQLIRDEITV